MAAMKQRVKNLKGSEYFPYPMYVKTNLTDLVNNVRALLNPRKEKKVHVLFCNST